MNKTKTRKTLYQVFSKNFSLDKNYDYGFEIPEGFDDNTEYENLYYFIPEDKIIYGLKFHKFFLRHSSNFNKDFSLDRDFMNETFIKASWWEDWKDEADLLYYLGFLDINPDFLEEDHPKYKFFIHDFFQTEEFKLLMIYKLLQNDSRNKIHIPTILSKEELNQIKTFLEKYDSIKTFESQNFSTFEFITNPMNHGGGFISGIMLPPDLDAIDECNEISLEKKTLELKNKNYEIINNQELVINAYYSYYDDNFNDIPEKFKES